MRRAPGEKTSELIRLGLNETVYDLSWGVHHPDVHIWASDNAVDTESSWCSLGWQDSICARWGIVFDSYAFQRLAELVSERATGRHDSPRLASFFRLVV